MREGAGFALPARIGALRAVDLVRAHAFEEIIAAVERADMLQAKPAELSRPVAAACAFRRRRAELARFVATGVIARAAGIFDPAVKP